MLMWCINIVRREKLNIFLEKETSDRLTKAVKDFQDLAMIFLFNFF